MICIILTISLTLLYHTLLSGIYQWQSCVIPSIGISLQHCSFVPKSGKRTDGLAKFYNGSPGRAEKGLEVSLLSVTDISRNTAYTLSVRQTPASAGDGETRTDIYLEHLRRARPALPAMKATMEKVRDGKGDANMFMRFSLEPAMGALEK